jgi:exopolysaccharide production protein ExoQ
MTSAGLWIPLLWLIIIGSRPVSVWMTGGIRYGNPDEYLEGSPLDASIFLALIVSGTLVLQTRKMRWSDIVSSNKYLFVFFMYCLLSIIWSDFPLVSFKRWIKDFGNIIMALIVLTEENPSDAIRAIFARCTYLAIPLSILFIKYLPDLGRYYHSDWTVAYSGVAGEKNALGALGLICGLFLVWDFLHQRDKENRHKPESPEPKALLSRQSLSRSAQASYIATVSSLRHSSPVKYDFTRSTTISKKDRAEGSQIMNRVDLATRITLLIMVGWVIDTANSSNALICLVLGVALMLAIRRSDANKKVFIRKLGTYIIILAIFSFLLSLIPGVLELFLESRGKDATFTGRTEVWADVLSIPNNILIGSGYQSFWLGPEIARLWIKYPFHPNQAHNGYIETYLNGGSIGLVLLLAMLFSAASKIKRKLLSHDPDRFILASFFFVGVIYNWSEAMFDKLSPIWLVILLAVLSYPREGLGLPNQKRPGGR